MCTAYVNASQFQGNFLVWVFRCHECIIDAGALTEAVSHIIGDPPRQLVPCLIKMNSSNLGLVSWTFLKLNQTKK